MSRGAWDSIKHSKWFYVSTYRRIIRWIFILLVTNVLLLAAVVYAHFTQAKPEYYATNGYMPPIMLTLLKTPNFSSEALLPPDPINNEVQKAIPQ